MKKRAAKPQWPSFHRICLLLNERWKKPLLHSQKKVKKSPLWGPLFWKRNGNRQTKTGEWGEPLPRMAIPKGDGHRWKCWAVPKPKTSKESGFLFLAWKSGIFHAAAQDIPQKSVQNRFFRRFPLLEKREKKRKKELGLVFNLWETHKGTNVGPAKKWLGEVTPFLELHINSDEAGPSTFCRLFVHDVNSLLKNN